MLGNEIINETLASLFKDAFSLLKNESKQYFSNRLLEYQVGLTQKCKFQKTLLHRFEDVLVEDFYVPLHLRAYHGYGDKGNERIPTDSIKKLIIKKRENLIIFGFAGSGKSTLVKHLILSSIKEKFKIPIFIELRNLVEFNGDFDRYVISQIFQYQRIGISESVVQRLLDKDHFIFILDGFDEIPSMLKSKVSQSILDFNQKYRNNNYLITSRYYEPLSSFSNYKSYEICEFTQSEVNEFIRKQFSKQDDSKANEIIIELSKTKNSAIKEYLQTPLLLSLFIITYLTHPEIPFNKSEFYYNIFDSLFYRLDKYLKSDFVHEKISKQSKDEFIKVLSVFSFMTTFEHKYEFAEKYINQKLDEIKDIKHLRFDNHDLLTDLTSNIGIILLDGNIYKFPHRTIQDYFCANFVIGINDIEYKKDIYLNIAFKAHEYIFLIELLLEIDFLDTLLHLVIPIIRNYIDLGKKNFNVVPITLHNAEKNSSNYNYILNILDNSFELRFIKSNFIHHNLNESNLAKLKFNNQILFEKSVPKELKNDVLKQLLFVDNGEILCSSIMKHVEKLKKQDKRIIDAVKNSR